MKKLIPLLFLPLFLALNNNYANKSYKATYMVPVAQELNKYNFWPLKSFRWHQVKKNVQMSYYLPDELVGDDKSKLIFKGKVMKNGSIRMVSKHGRASCEKYENDNYVCLMNFKGLNPKLNQVKEILKKHYAKNEVKFRLAVAHKFTGDPIGIVHVRRR